MKKQIRVDVSVKSHNGHRLYSYDSDTETCEIGYGAPSADVMMFMNVINQIRWSQDPGIPVGVPPAPPAPSAETDSVPPTPPEETPQ